MCVGAQTQWASLLSCRARGPWQIASLTPRDLLGWAINRGGVHQSRSINRELLCVPFSKEAARVSFVACGAGLFNQHEDAIGIAVDSQFDDLLTVAAFLSFSPKFVSGAAEVGCESGSQGFAISLFVHPREHENFARLRILCDCRQETLDRPREIGGGRGGRYCHGLFKISLKMIAALSDCGFRICSRMLRLLRRGADGAAMSSAEGTNEGITGGSAGSGAELGAFLDLFFLGFEGVGGAGGRSNCDGNRETSSRAGAIWADALGAGVSLRVAGVLL